MKRKILLAFMALATSFSLVSCGDEIGSDDETSFKQVEPSLTDNGSEMVLTYSVGGANYKEIYTYDEEKVTSWTQEMTYEYKQYADNTYKSYKAAQGTEGSELLKNVTQNGNTVILEFDCTNYGNDHDSVYAGLQQKYETYKQL